jgi:hypothetical protein
MHQQQAPLGLGRFESVNPNQGHTDNFKIVPWQNQAAIDQPGAAGSRERLFIFGKRPAAPVIVVPRDAVNRRLNLPNET